MQNDGEFRGVNLYYSTVNSFLIKLYRGAQETPMVDFKTFVFEHLQTILQFDSGLWGTYSLSCQHLDIKNVYHFNPPEDLITHYGEFIDLVEYVGKKGMRVAKLKSHLPDSFELFEVGGKKQWHGADIYHLQQKKNHLENITSIIINKENELINMISLYRTNASAGFTKQEKLLQSFLIPHFAESLRINILRSFKQGAGGLNSFGAVVDRAGTIIEAENNFISLLNRTGLIETKKIIASALLRKINSPKKQNFKVAGIQFKTSTFDDLTFLQAMKISPLAQLTKRKIEICELLMSGLSDKHIGKQLAISHHTVSNHLKEIYKILQINSRAEAIAYLQQHQAIFNEVSAS